jgi:hypothetical protein
LLAVTTFKGDEPYVIRCLETFSKHWPCKLIAYYETKPDFEHEKIEYRDFFSIPGVTQFLKRLERMVGTNGDFGGMYDYRFNAYKFCRKVFAMDAVFDEDDKVFFIGSDVITFRDVPEILLLDLIHEVPFCYLGRDTYTETDFLGFNTKHRDFQKFRNKFLYGFTSGRIFQRTDGWHDCLVFDMAREGLKGNNLSPNGAGVGHVFVRSVIGEYCDHLKGPKRKALGYSPEHPLGRGSLLGDGERSDNPQKRAIGENV